MSREVEMIEQAKAARRRRTRVRILSFAVVIAIVFILIIEPGTPHLASGKNQRFASTDVHKTTLAEPAELTGAAAINYLKQQGTYESLLGASRKNAPDAQLAREQHSPRMKEQVAAPASSGTTPWDFEERFLASDGQDLDNFGIAVAISGDTAIVGSRKYRNGPGEGEVYIFVHEGVFWS